MGTIEDCDELSHLSARQRNYVDTLERHLVWLGKKVEEGQDGFKQEFYATKFAVWYITNITGEKDLLLQLKQAHDNIRNLKAKLERRTGKIS